MKAIILGSAAGGGVPQWNCACPVCALAWAGDPRVRPRTQSSLAVSPDGETWLLINASPDLRQQLVATPALHPRSSPRHSPIVAVLLTNGDVDHVAGLLTLRERQPLVLYGTGWVLGELDRNPIFGVLHPMLVDRKPIDPDTPFSPLDGLAVTLFVVPGKVPLWREGADAEEVPDTTTVGVEIVCNDTRMIYLPGCAAVTDALRQRLAGADAVLFDGTVFTDDEMLRSGTGTKTGRRMGHLPLTGPGGSLDALAGVPVRQRILVHLNNTNPVLVEESAERGIVEAAGWVVAHDGMVIE